MQISPDLSAFSTIYESGVPQVVWTRLVADLETPVSAMLKLAGDRANSFLLESVEGGAVRGRYSMIGFDPDVIWRCIDTKAQINRSPALSPDAFEEIHAAPLEALRTFIADSRIELPEELPPMAAGVFGYLGYDMVREMEVLPTPNPDVLDVPDSILIRPQVMVIFDAVKDEITLVSPVRPADGISSQAAYTRACERLQEAADALDKPIARSGDQVDMDLVAKITSNTKEADYLDRVARAKEYIAAGDIFQVVLSQRFEAPFELPPFSLYRALRRVNPAPFLYFLNFGAFSLAGSSPEILVRVRDGEVTIRPIAGTRPRGATPAEDRAYAKDLLDDPKERAEHLMLLDLGRNDVGRVAEIGSVTVTDQFFIEYYSHVMHIVSNVTGSLEKGLDPLDALGAGFPAGTVSGAPKVRAMEIIDELEHEKRGPYAGCVGYFSADGAMDTCIVLRTSLIKDGKMYVQAGAGIVADSIPENEQLECENKAKALFRAAEEAARFASSVGRGQ